MAPVSQELEPPANPGRFKLVDLAPSELPILWDADFLYGPKDANGHDTFVLCEINVSSVYPFPMDALGPIATETARRLAARN